MPRIERDDLDRELVLPERVTRVVSLVPSLTEAIAHSAPGLLVGATDWCTHPADLDVERLRGTKNPDVRRIAELAPDLVVTNKEENRKLDVERLTAAGVPVWVTLVEDVPSALRSLTRLFTAALGRPEPDWLVRARGQLGGPVPEPVASGVVCVWRDPWMVVGSRNFATDLLARVGVRNVFGEHADRYPKLDLAEITGADLVVLPDEPYVFGAEDGPEAFPGQQVRLVSGRLLTWYGPSLAEAVPRLREQLRLAC
ncbi:helical backbone metal receptor [Kutzneria viridogrisea]|uniref:ABC-type Fe3+-hydroxamate transport system substrate-binding protein n=1 Tax=Kutzneria viridogrisea TaxID=47990 RepID=A0ABR6BMR0_9PSEU|nr:ABC-type Fe3+-hydroxamate transport system substrate-binding protein [Kutzneria viridogrisea]